ncbi:MAG: radical SAM protein [bacterium]|nr:radical SAM protein [bacterium]
MITPRDLNRLARYLYAKYFIISVRISGRSFACRALSGQCATGNNLAIYSDLQVACNCHNINGQAVLGDLRKNTWPEIISGQRARDFKKILSGGGLPLSDCSRCSDLMIINKAQAESFASQSAAPNSIMVENTVLCNLNCLSCNRPRVYMNRRQTKMTLNDIRKISSLIKKYNIKKIDYFNWGEPFLSPDIKEEIQLIKQENPGVLAVVSTNGTQLQGREKIEAALLFDHIIISLDGPDNKTVNLYQRGSNFDLVYNNIRGLIAARKKTGRNKPIIEWKYVVFRWNDSVKLRDKAIELARSAGLDKISFWHTLSPIYGFSWKYFFKYFTKTGKVEEIDFIDSK